MTDTAIGWFDDVIGLEDFSPETVILGVPNEDILDDPFAGLESLDTLSFAQSKSVGNGVPFFNPVNIAVENGIYYVTIYACMVGDESILSQKLAIWLASLKETDHIKLSIAALKTGLPFDYLISTMAALANTKAKIEILLDQIVIDGLAYFYLLADEVTVLEGGALFIPSYVAHRSEDTSTPWKAVHDFYEWIVEDSVILGRLTEEEGQKLSSGTHVIIPVERFQK